MMDVSVNELKTTVSKAATGCGMPVGLAEENAAIAASLAHLGIDAVEAAARALRSYVALGTGQPPERTGVDQLRFNADGVAVMPAAWHLPLACLWLCGKPFRRVEVRNVDDLVWMAGTLVRASERVDRPLAIVAAGSGQSILVCRRGEMTTPLDALAGRKGEAMILCWLAEMEDESIPAAHALANALPSRATVSAPEDWFYLRELGDRMLVESSEYSRLHGAGYVG